MESEEKKRVIISGLDIPFWDLVWFMVKLALASFPAVFILYLFVVLFTMLFGAVSDLFIPGFGMVH
ncbi:hypothetical protein [Nitratifractor salsuginis]|uniref:Uncharacterized protein n=1 Tax=Nitratifractor salsuginis (strain DSM 16511 / JCM 12458 / E9I37-1) TaxID=749222 RepID=E6X1T5_NITSE|nr:hypothetical protein [Nitratifractor salsuginis]ADV45943.1 hypothetical protein Nitsa_0675 [Nitratifractor salsuginis DSM 16511]